MTGGGLKGPPFPFEAARRDRTGHGIGVKTDLHRLIDGAAAPIFGW